MQDRNYENAFEGVRKMLADLGLNDQLIQENIHNIDPSLMAKYNEQMTEVNAQKAKLDKLEEDLKKMEL